MRFSLICVLAFCWSFTFAQNYPGVLQEQHAYYSQFGELTELQWDSVLLNGEKRKIYSGSNRSSAVCNLNKRVYGWEPYWGGTAYQNYDWSNLTDLCYFSYEVNPSTGNANSTHNWATAAVVTAAQNAGVNVSLCATLFSSHATFFGNATAQQTLITNLISAVQQRNAKGVNIDFEGVPLAQKTNLTNFLINLCNQMHSQVPGSEVSIAMPAVDWSTVYDIPALASYIDLFIIMGYDYYYGGSTTAGPTDPLYTFQTSYNYNLSKSVTYYLKQGVPNSKLLLGLPYYSHEYETTSSTVPSAVVSGGYSASKTYKVVMDNANGYYSNKLWDNNSYTPYYVFQVGSAWHQLYINDAYSMGKRFDMVNIRNIGGIGIWALGYDDGYDDFWNKIEEKFSSCQTVACSDTIYDLGGPARNYYDNESFTYTISPDNASTVSLTFNSFDTELNYDSLWIYNGTTTSSPLLGVYTGTTSPGTLSSTGGSITLKWKSDNATTKPGWMAVWNCTIDNISPTTQVNAISGWITQNFTAGFTDNDNAGGTGIEKGFYQVIDFDGTEWRGNNTRGFFNDNFNNALHADWTQVTGTWTNSGGYLVQSNTSLTNTNIYTEVTQNLSNRYLYHWQGKIDGTGTNRRAGIHFFCDDPTLPNRGNSYFAWFRVDQDEVQLYKVVNDVFTLVASAPYALNPSQWYDFKITYDRINGKMVAYVNDDITASWTDPSPYNNGAYISMRSGDCSFTVNDLKVYRSRAATVNITVGSSLSDIRYQNTNPTTPAARIKSIVTDAIGNISTVANKDVNVDWTAPTIPSYLNDGSASDIDTTFSMQLSSNWDTSNDPHSGIASYYYSIGTNPGDSDVVAWTSTPASDYTNSLSLLSGQEYFTSVRVQNGAGLVNNKVTSDGQVYLYPVGIDHLESAQLMAYPTIFTNYIQLAIDNQVVKSIEIFTIEGKSVYKSKQSHSSDFRIDNLEYLSPGIYLMKAVVDEKVQVVRLVKGY